MERYDYIPRPLYMEKVKPYINKDLIKVFLGQRRVGKSYVMRQVADEIQKDNVTANIIYIDKERLEFSDIIDEKTLYQFVCEHLCGQSNYLFIDEVQEIKNFQLALRSLLNERKCDIYCSGSNAFILSGELSTYLSGRSISIHVHALNYMEYLQFYHMEPSRDSLRSFLLRGGMPYLVNLPDRREVIFEYLRSVYSTILLKDVVAHQSIRDVPFLEDLCQFLADNVGSLFSVKNISDYLKSQHISKSVSTIQNYLQALADAFLIYKVPRAEVQGMRIFEIGEKYYFEDFGIRNALRQIDIQVDISKLMENAVYAELQSRGYQVYVGRTQEKEVDFVAIRNGERVYVQVTYLLNSEKTIEREFGNLASIKDNYPKYVVSMDEYPVSQPYQGIVQLHLQDFLTKSL
ncbi:MAG: ATP-binding protein [Prevotella sp.]|nr:ATP-binding protein [Prevotella sp.]MBQ9232379.1 ATP-binding protein [Prevotella sp.]